MRIFVTGATGLVGAEVARQASEAGIDVRALVRDPSRAPANCEPVVGDLNDPATFVDHLGGCDGIFLLSGYEHLERLLEEASTAGVKLAVLLSSGGVGLSKVDNAVVAYHRKAEEAVRVSRLDWAFLRPFTFMTNTLEWADSIRTTGTVTAPFPDVPVAVVDPVDIAAVAVATFHGDDQAQRVYRLTGSQPLTVSQRVDILSEVLGRPIRLRAQTDEVAHADLSAKMPAEYVESFFDIFVRGAYDEGQVFGGIRAALDRDPRTFREWCVDHREAFA